MLKRVKLDTNHVIESCKSFCETRLGRSSVVFLVNLGIVNLCQSRNSVNLSSQRKESCKSRNLSEHGIKSEIQYNIGAETRDCEPE